jgi:hypothetical protein
MKKSRKVNNLNYSEQAKRLKFVKTKVIEKIDENGMEEDRTNHERS